MVKSKDKRPKPASVANPNPAETIPSPATPSWPPFKPPLPVTDLAVETVIEHKVVVIRSFFPRSLCRDYVSFLKTLPLTTTPGKPKRGEAVRVNDRFEIHDPLFAHRLWIDTGLKDALHQDQDVARLWDGKSLGLSPRIRIYRYTKGQFFAPH